MPSNHVELDTYYHDYNQYNEIYYMESFIPYKVPYNHSYGTLYFYGLNEKYLFFLL